MIYVDLYVVFILYEVLRIRLGLVSGGIRRYNSVFRVLCD